MPEIVKLAKPSEKDLTELREIFFESSTRKDFADEADKDHFFFKYVGVYLKHFPEYLWVAREGRILGYMIGAPVTDETELHRVQPHLQIFQKHFTDYPAHLHVNFHPDARGMGLGSKLFSQLEKQFQEAGIRGVHIMTGPDSRNKIFYQRLGFDFEVVLDFRGSPILLMGKRL